MFNEALDLKQHKLAKYRQKVLEKKVIERSHSTRKTILKRAEAALLAGKTPSLAAAEIQEIVGNIASDAGAEIKTVRILQPDLNGKGMYVAIPVEITINSRIGELTQLLYKLDRSKKLLRITKLGIKSRRGYKRRRSAQKQAQQGNIVTTVTIEGFVKKIEI
jgi:hypothetical protein